MPGRQARNTRLYQHSYGCLLPGRLGSTPLRPQCLEASVSAARPSITRDHSLILCHLTPHGTSPRLSPNLFSWPPSMSGKIIPPAAKTKATHELTPSPPPRTTPSYAPEARAAPWAHCGRALTEIALSYGRVSPLHATPRQGLNAAGPSSCPPSHS